VIAASTATASRGTSPDIGVIIPLFNGAPWIRQTLVSVLDQTLPPREILVVNDGSSDDEPAIVRSFPQVVLHRHPGKGTHKTRQFGFSRSTAALRHLPRPGRPLASPAPRAARRAAA